MLKVKFNRVCYMRLGGGEYEFTNGQEVLLDDVDAQRVEARGYGSVIGRKGRPPGRPKKSEKDPELETIRPFRKQTGIKGTV